MKYTFAILFLSMPFLSSACGNYGNPNDGCAEFVKGVQTEAGSAIEIYLGSASWFPGHVCSGSSTVQFSGSELEVNSALAIGMATYLSGKGPIYFRCHEVYCIQVSK